MANSSFTTSDGLFIFSISITFTNITKNSATATSYFNLHSVSGGYTAINATNKAYTIKRSTGSPSSSGSVNLQASVYSGETTSIQLGTINLTSLSANTTYTVNATINTQGIVISLPSGTNTLPDSLEINSTFKTLPSTSSYSSHVNINGSWKTVNTIYVKVNGTWKTVSEAYVKDENSWKRVK